MASTSLVRTREWTKRKTGSFQWGWLDDDMIVMVWTPRGEVRRMISMRKANDREKTLYASYLE